MKTLVLDEDLNNPTPERYTHPKPRRAPNFKHTATTKPKMDWDGEVVEVTSDVYVEPVKDWNELLEELGYDSDQYEIQEPVKVSAWDAQTEEGLQKLYSYKVQIRARRDSTHEMRDEDYADLIELIRKHRPLSEDAPDGDAWFFLALSDWQMGKPDGDGVEGTVKYLLGAVDDTEKRIKELRKLGREIGTIVVALMGDMVEGCDGFYASQTFTVQLNRRQQVRVTRRLLIKFLTRLSKLAKKVVVLAVPGNHGENRQGNKSYTQVGDNDDVAVLEMAYDALSCNPDAYGHIEWIVPENEAYIILDLPNGKQIGFAHGHKTSNSTSKEPQKTIREWWKDQAFGKTPIGMVDLLVTGHYHHFSAIEYDNDAIHLQCPSADGGSEWFSDVRGLDARRGTLTFVVDADSGKPYRDLEIL